MKQTDFLVIGSGIAGLSYALKVAQHFPIKRSSSSPRPGPTRPIPNTLRAASPASRISNTIVMTKHIQDTLIAGDGLCNPHTVEIVVNGRAGADQGDHRMGYPLRQGFRRGF
jgi:L-aspartate oxidase